MKSLEGLRDSALGLFQSFGDKTNELEERAKEIGRADLGSATADSDKDDSNKKSDKPPALVAETASTAAAGGSGGVNGSDGRAGAVAAAADGGAAPAAKAARPAAPLAAQLKPRPGSGAASSSAAAAVAAHKKAAGGGMISALDIKAAAAKLEARRARDAKRRAEQQALELTMLVRVGASVSALSVVYSLLAQSLESWHHRSVKMSGPHEDMEFATSLGIWSFSSKGHYHNDNMYSKLVPDSAGKGLWLAA